MLRRKKREREGDIWLCSTGYNRDEIRDLLTIIIIINGYLFIII